MISIKGLREGLLIVCEEEAWLPQLREIEEKFNTNAHFFRGGRIALDIKNLELTPDDLGRIQALFSQYEVSIWAILTRNDKTTENITRLGLPGNMNLKPASTETTISSTAEPAIISAANVEGTDGLLVRRIVRSGQVLRHPGHIVVVGDVNPGAQLIAGRDIIVWGKLHGYAHAGALGDTAAVVCALELSPHLLRIADAARSSSLQKRRGRVKRPEMAVIDEQEIRIIAWLEKQI